MDFVAFLAPDKNIRLDKAKVRKFPLLVYMLLLRTSIFDTEELEDSIVVDL